MNESKRLEHAELLTKAKNFAVVQLPGRKFPGVVFQGDSLSAFVSELQQVLVLLNADQKQEAIEATKLLFEQYADVLKSYEFVCKEHQIELPYVAQTILHR